MKYEGAALNSTLATLNHFSLFQKYLFKKSGLNTKPRRAQSFAEVKKSLYFGKTLSIIQYIIKFKTNQDTKIVNQRLLNQCSG